jgi:hypothetical protein
VCTVTECADAGRRGWRAAPSFVRLAIVAAVLAGLTAPVRAQEASEVQVLREEIDRLRAELEAARRDYTARLDALEAAFASRADAASAPAQPPAEAAAAQAAVPVPPGAAGAGGPAGALPVYGNVNALSKIFNPDIAVVGDVLGAAGENVVRPSPAFELREAELSLQAIVDPYARADVFVGVGPDGVDLEEGFVTFPTLPGGFLARFGKVRAAFGKINLLHGHVLPWADRPLVTENLLGGEEAIAPAGASVARLVPNPWTFLELTGEVFGGDSGVFTAPSPKDLTFVGHLRGYQDLSEASNVDFGASIAYGHNDAGADATTRLVGIDATFRYRPLRRARDRRLQARTELVWSRRSEAGGTTAFGAFGSAEYQIARRWFAGVRLDYSERALDPETRDTGTSWLLTFWPSEFSQLRGQYRRTRYEESYTAHELLFQVLFSIGAHGAHAF